MQKYPVLLLLLPYLIGVIFSFYFPIPPMYIFGLLIITIVLLFAGWIFYRLSSFPLKNGSLLFVTSASCLLGCLSVTMIFFPSPKQTNEKNTNFQPIFTVHVCEEPVEKTKSVKIFAYMGSTTFPEYHSKILLYFASDSSSRQIQQGDILLVSANLSDIAPPQNPYMFDNKNYMKKKGVILSGYVPSGRWKRLTHSPPPKLTTSARKLQHYFSDLFAQNGMQNEEYSVITAVLLGNNEAMNPELKTQYASAGVSHILCVSGMHVGIIYMIINFLLKPFDKFRQLQYLKALLLLASIWFYAQITGLSPSVQRSATMFTFVTVGSLLRRPTSVFHSLFASMFFLLLINPLILFEIGFQMSYLAVFGIVLIQPLIYGLFTPRTRLVNYFWELVTVSIAAQCATFPLSIYYFGQFPNYFLLANMSVISLSFIIVVTGVFLLSISWITVFSKWISSLLVFEIKLMNGIVKGIDALPGAVTSNIPLSFAQTLILYTLLLLILLVCIKKKSKIIYWILVDLLIFVVSVCYSKIKSVETQEIDIYSVNKMAAIGFRNNDNAILLLDSSALADPSCYDFNIKNHARQERIDYQIIPMDTMVFYKENFLKMKDFVYCNGHTFYILSGKKWFSPPPKPVAVDYLYLCHNPKIPMKKLKQIIDFKSVIIDMSNSVYHEKKWMDSCETYHVPCYSLRQMGYLSLKK